MSEAVKLNRDIFMALAAIGWADGRLDPDEADAIVRAAVEAGLDLEAIEEIENATRERIDLGDGRPQRALEGGPALRLRRRVLDRAARRSRSPRKRRQALAALGERLGVPERPRAHAESIAREIAELPEGDRPARYDLAQAARNHRRAAEEGSRGARLTLKEW